jgi:hypothetical protein
MLMYARTNRCYNEGSRTNYVRSSIPHYIPVTYLQPTNKDGSSRFLRNCGTERVLKVIMQNFAMQILGAMTLHTSRHVTIYLSYILQHITYAWLLYQLGVSCAFLYPPAFHICLMCVLTYLNFDIWRSLWSLIYAIRVSHSLASSIDWILREMSQVDTFAGVEKTKQDSGWTVVCPVLMQQREKITDIHFL